MNDSKDKITYNICKSHTFKSERDLYRLCPSKLSNEELENLYFVLLDNNNQQKKTINRQLDEIKVLNTKLQRKSGQKVILGNKDCCNSSRIIINEQKESLADLQRANERLTDRIKMLNMRLCSAKQFLRRGSQTTSYCSKCFSSTSLLKNISTSALSTKRSESNIHMTQKTCKIFNREKDHSNKTTHSVSTQVNMSTSCIVDVCEQNQCRNTIDELKQKVFNLEEELSRLRLENLENSKKKESQASIVHRENIRLRAECSSILEKLKEKEKECVDLLQELRTSESQCDNLHADLLIEKSKVSELETQMKASDISEQITKVLDVYMKKAVVFVPINTANVESKTISNIASEDSGYTDTNRSRDHDKKESSIMNVEQEKQEDVQSHIASLQTQLDDIMRSFEEQHKTEDYNAIEISTQQGKYIDSGDTKNRTNLWKTNLQPSSSPTNNTSDQSVSKSTSKIPLPIKQSHITNLSENVNNIHENDAKNKENNDNNINNSEVKLFIDKKIFDTSKVGSNSIKKDTDYNINIDNNEKDATDTKNENDEINDISKEINVLDIFVEKYNSDMKNTNENIENSSGLNTYVVGKKKSKASRVKSVDVNVKDHLDVKSKMKPLATSSPSRMRHSVLTYTSDNTDCEISSLTDLTNDKSPIDYISPGEERFTAFNSSTITTTDYGSLSEGELPINGVKKCTIADLVMKDKMADSIGKTSKNKMEEALNAVGTELTKCRELLYTRRNGTLDTNMEKLHKFSYPYNFTLPLQ